VENAKAEFPFLFALRARIFDYIINFDLSCHFSRSLRERPRVISTCAASYPFLQYRFTRSIFDVAARLALAM
jgi:hypothetical protein